MRLASAVPKTVRGCIASGDATTEKGWALGKLPIEGRKEVKNNGKPEHRRNAGTYLP